MMARGVRFGLAAVAWVGGLAGPVRATTDEERLQQVEALFASPYSEEMVYRTDRLLESSTGILESVRTAPSVATVISAADLRDLGATTVEEALAMVPGLHVLPGSTNLLLPSYSFRGLLTGLNPQVLVAVNGQPISLGYHGARPYVVHLPVAAVSRLEVIRGPGSALHGADAFAGVINIITKAGYEIEGSEIGARYGSFDTVETWLQHGGDHGGWDLALNLDLRRGSGDPHRIVERDLRTAMDAVYAPFGPPASLAPGELPTGYENLNAYLSLAHGGWQARLWGGLQHDRGLGNGINQVLDPYGSMDSQWLALDLGYRRPQLLPDLDGALRLTAFHQRVDGFYRQFPPGSILAMTADGNISPSPATTVYRVRFTEGLFGEPIVAEGQVGLEAVGLYSGWASHRLRCGGGLRYLADRTDNFKNFGPGVLDTSGFLTTAVNDAGGTLTYLNGDSPYIFMQDQERLIWYGLAQDQWALAPAWELSAGLRLDHYSDFGLTANPRLALVWEATPAATWKLLYGRAFRPPSFAELYLINNPVTWGSRDLEPETVDTLELAYALDPGQSWRLSTSLFAYRANGLIEFVPDPKPAVTATAANFRDIEAYGGELELEVHLTGDLRLRASYSYQHAVDDASNLPVPDTPRHLVKLNPHWAFLPDWSLDGQLLWVAGRSRVETDTRPEMDDYALVHLTLRRQRLLRHLEAACAVRNLFDTGAREATDGKIPGDIPLEGRSIWVELRLAF
ncbi:MAG: TonB-dependent receptor [Thermodesulfobacteriota bacterium]